MYKLAPLKSIFVHIKELKMVMQTLDAGYKERNNLSFGKHTLIMKEEWTVYLLVENVRVILPILFEKSRAHHSNFLIHAKLFQ